MISNLIQELLSEALKKGKNMSNLSRELGISMHVVRLWYKAGAQPSTKNLKKLEEYVLRRVD